MPQVRVAINWSAQSVLNTLAFLAIFFFAGLLLVPLANALPKVRILATIGTTCNGGNVDCPTHVTFDGAFAGDISSLLSGIRATGLLDGQAHSIKLASPAPGFCGSIQEDLDDYGPVTINTWDCRHCDPNDPNDPNQPIVVKVGEMTFGDQCGSGYELEAPVSLPGLNAPGGAGGRSGGGVSYTNGQLTTSQLDFVIQDPFFPIRFTRTYNSHDQRDGVLGWGWSHNFEIELYKDASVETPYYSLSDGSSLYTNFPYTRIVDDSSDGGLYESGATFTGSWVDLSPSSTAYGLSFGCNSARFTEWQRLKPHEKVNKEDGWSGQEEPERADSTRSRAWGNHEVNKINASGDPNACDNGDDKGSDGPRQRGAVGGTG